MESYANAVNGKYGLVELNERFSDVRLPDIILADTRETQEETDGVFTRNCFPRLGALGKGEQIILFRTEGLFAYWSAPMWLDT